MDKVEMKPTMDRRIYTFYGLGERQGRHGGVGPVYCHPLTGDVNLVFPLTPGPSYV